MKTLLKAVSAKIEDVMNTIMDDYFGVTFLAAIFVVGGGITLLIVASIWENKHHPCLIWTSERIEYVKGTPYRVRDCVERKP